MFSKIMVPVDLAHAKALEKALTCAADLAKQYDAEIVYVGVTTNTPGSVAHSPAEYAEKLAVFAKTQASTHGVKASADTVVTHDPAVDLDDALMRETVTTGADLVVMQSHVPGLMDYVWPGHGGKIAEHAKCSVMVVRG